MVRARTEFEEFGQDRTRIIITEIPYQVNKRMLIKNMADQVEDKRLEGISDIRDESDRNGMRIVIELKRDANPQVVLNRLFAQTQLQTTLCHQHAGSGGITSPSRRSSPCGTFIDEYLAFQEEVIIRRTSYDLKKAQERAHLLEGLLIAQDNIDEVIQIIRTSYDDAKEKPDGALRSGRRSGPGHSGYALEGAAGPGPGEAGGRVQGAGGADRLLQPSCCPTRS
ncbi:MAG: DNA gyrase subunit A [Dysosmobacter sp.]